METELTLSIYIGIPLSIKIIVFKTDNLKFKPFYNNPHSSFLIAIILSININSKILLETSKTPFSPFPSIQKVPHPLSSPLKNHA